eukprot:CAMPEP_0185018450 /NCGR_PEP_ID=MMETSP1103-20130426/1168_1 /TAXON_ID=36769 /ORGANISM="Paraphysomonas bandaiensis, Strain Caron Lab Isolate" /LENGTH=292 /DNA_ID=CAMNT_0027548263 /DNA_START=87 /DNA_END=965 /DNA_ORIENTATION=+
MPVQRRGDHYKRSSIANYIAPDNGLRGKMERQGMQPKNHMKDNLQQMRAVQSKHREEREEANRGGKELYKLSQFRDVGARVFEPQQKKSSLSGRHEGVFLVRGASEKRREELAEEGRQRRLEIENDIKEARLYSNEQPASPRKGSVPRAEEVARLAPRTNADFVSRNRKEAVKVRQPVQQKEEPTKHEAYGRVPEYLESRKAQWASAEEERRRNAPDPSCPPGMCVMPESERVQTLDTLQQSKQECLRQLERMPFVVETPSMKRRQDELEGKLREIDKAIEVFSKDKVYVAR